MSCVSGDWFGIGASEFLFVVFSVFLFLGLLRVVARLLHTGLSYGFSRCLFGVSYVEGHIQPFGTAILAQSSWYTRRLLFAVLRSPFSTSKMATSASTLNQEGEVPSVVEVEGTPLTAGVEGAVVELAATD